MNVRTLKDYPENSALMDRVRESRQAAVGSFVLSAPGKRVLPLMGPVFDKDGSNVRLSAGRYAQARLTHIVVNGSQIAVCDGESPNRSLAVTALNRYFRAARAGKRLPDGQVIS